MNIGIKEGLLLAGETDAMCQFSEVLQLEVDAVGREAEKVFCHEFRLSVCEKGCLSWQAERQMPQLLSPSTVSRVTARALLSATGG